MNKRVDIESPFIKLAAINVNDHIEKKNGLSYLSWPFAVSELMKADPMANWEFHQPQMFGLTMMVSCTVTAFSKPITMHLPVMDHRNKAIENPDSFAVNKNMMRCLVKAIACHGLGLYIYANEDLPENEAEALAKKASEMKVTPTAGAADRISTEQRTKIDGIAEEINHLFSIGEIAKMVEVRNQVTDADEFAYLASLLPSNVKTAIKKAKETAKVADSVQA